MTQQTRDEGLIRPQNLATRLIHHPYLPPPGFEAVAPGVHKASTVFFGNVAELRSREWKDKSGYTYGLHGTPTTFTLEERIATLEGGSHCLLVPSGLAAVGLVDMAFLRQGDELLIPDNAYGPNKALAEAELVGWGIITRYYDPMDPADLARQISPSTRLVWLEAPGSITLEYPDLPALVQVVREANVQMGRATAVQLEPVKPTGQQSQRPILTVLDNTWGAGVAFCGFDLGADIVMQALTKYPSGGADVLMGSVVTRDLALHKSLLLTHMRVGHGVAGNDAELVLRGLQTIALRYHAQDLATRQLAQWMQAQPQVAEVFHPALANSPGHAAWARDAKAAGCLFSVVFQPAFSQPEVDAFCDRLRLFKLGWSWAGPVSLCAPYDVPSLRTRPWPHKGSLVRFAVGLEAADDLQADLSASLAHMAVI